MLVATGVGVLLGIAEWRARLLVGSGPKECKTVDLTPEGREHLVGSDLLVVGLGKGAASCIDVIFFLEFMVA